MEKCSDTDGESGWTMYIGSQICNAEEDGNIDDHDHDHDGGGNNENKPTCRGDYDGSESDDDSMASDASSGPIEQPVIIPNVTKEEIEVFGEQGKWFSANNTKKPCRQVKKARDERRVRRSEKNDDHDHQNTVTIADSAESHV